MTLADFYENVLRKLKVVPTNGAALSGDLARVESVYPQLHAMLLSEGLVEWGVAEDIPEKYVIPLTAIVAYQVADEFSIPQEDLAKLKMEGSVFEPVASLAERQLRKLLAPDYVDYTAPTSYY